MCYYHNGLPYKILKLGRGWDGQVLPYSKDQLCNSWISAFIKYIIATYILMIHVGYVKNTDTPTEQLQGQEHITSHTMHCIVLQNKDNQWSMLLSKDHM